jgi:hypothetical protein
MLKRFWVEKYASQKANFAHDLLNCRGVNTDARPLDLCLELKKAGHRLQGYYVLDTPSSGTMPLKRAAHVAKCNFDVDVNDDKFQETTQSRLPDTRVGFAAHTNSTLFVPSSIPSNIRPKGLEV